MNGTNYCMPKCDINTVYTDIKSCACPIGHSFNSSNVCLPICDASIGFENNSNCSCPYL